MSVTRTITVRNVLSNKARFLLTSFAVLIGVAFVSGSFMLTDSLKNVFKDLFGEINQNIDVQVRTKVAFGNKFSGNPVPVSLLDVVRKVPGVGVAEGSVQQSTVTIVGKDGKAKLPSGGPTIGVSWSSSKLSSLHLKTGRQPTGAGEAALDTRAASKAGYRTGDTMTLLLPEGKVPYTLVGTFDFGKSNSLAGAYLVAFDPVVAANVLGTGGGFNTIDVHAADGVDKAKLLTDVRAALPTGYEAIDNETLVKQSTDQVNGFLDSFGTALLVFAFISLFVSAFIINNTFAILMSQRIRELAMLRAVGATGRQITMMVIGEALMVGLVASVLGMAGGALVATGLRALFSAAVGTLPGGLVLTARTVIFALVVGFGVTLVSALAPARRAATVPPVAAMSGSHSFMIGNATRRLVLAAVAAAGGLALLVWGLFGRPGGTKGVLSLSGAGALLLFLGVAGLSRLIARPVVLAIGRVLAPVARLGGRLSRLPVIGHLGELLSFVGRAIKRPFTRKAHREPLRYRRLPADGSGMAPKLARENAARTPRRTSATASALMIGLALVSAIAVLGASLKSTFRSQLKSSVTADLFITDRSFTGFSSAVTDKIRTVPGIESASGFRAGEVQVNGSTKQLGAVDAQSFGDLVDLKVKQGKLTDMGLNEVFVHKDPAKDLKLHVGSQLDVRFPSTGVKKLTVAGIYDDASVAGNWLVDLSTYKENFTGQPNDFFAGAKLAKGADLETVKSAVADLLSAEAPSLKVQDRQEFRKSQEQQLNGLLAVINGLLGLAVFIAVIGIANTLALSVYERTRELGLLRAVGMTTLQMRRMVRWEAAIVSVFGALLGIAVGVVLGLLVSVALPSTAVSKIVLPFVQLLLYVGAALLAGVWAARKPAKRAARMNVLDAIAHE